MAKANPIANLLKENAKLKKRIERDAVEFYASMVLVLNEEGYGFNDIVDICQRVGDLWESTEKGKDIVQLCKEKTGIDISGPEYDAEDMA